MEQKDQKFSVLITMLLITALIAGGIILRIVPGRHTPTTLVENSLTPYYFDKTQRLLETGRFPQKDIWEWAPAPHPENAPPGLAYISFAAFRISKFFSPDLTLLDFANIFPIIAFALWCAAVLIIWKGGSRGDTTLPPKRQRKNVDAGLVFLAVLAFTPAAVSLTGFANYTQETLGVFLLFLALYAFARFSPLFAIIAITLLILFWQQFPIFYFVIAPALILGLAKTKGLRETFWFAAILSTPLLLSELIIKLFVGNDYSAFAMIKEFLLGFWLGFNKNPDMITAMVRGNWRQPGIMGIYQFYGPLFISLLAVGIVVSLRRWKEMKHQISILAALIGFAMVWQFEKEKNLALGLFLFPIALGLEAIFETAEVRLPFLRDLRRPNIVRFLGLRKSKKLIAASIAAISLIGGWFFFSKTPTGIAMITKYHPPKPEIAVTHEKNPDGTIDVKFKMTNRGGTSFFSDKLWFGLSSGMHIEVCNAEILKSTAASLTSPYNWRYYAVYPYSRWGDCYFTEIKFRQLRTREFGDAHFIIRPLANREPVIYYRGWMTETSCILRYKDAGDDTPEEQVLIETEGEPCIIRTPPHNDQNYPLCPIRVQAARMKLQDFRCHQLLL
jgi:hypothetical protein